MLEIGSGREYESPSEIRERDHVTGGLSGYVPVNVAGLGPVARVSVIGRKYVLVDEVGVRKRFGEMNVFILG